MLPRCGLPRVSNRKSNGSSKVDFPQPPRPTHAIFTSRFAPKCKAVQIARQKTSGQMPFRERMRKAPGCQTPLHSQARSAAARRSLSSLDDPASARCWGAFMTDKAPSRKPCSFPPCLVQNSAKAVRPAAASFSAWALSAVTLCNFCSRINSYKRGARSRGAWQKPVPSSATVLAEFKRLALSPAVSKSFSLSSFGCKGEKKGSASKQCSGFLRDCCRT